MCSQRRGKSSSSSLKQHTNNHTSTNEVSFEQVVIGVIYDPHRDEMFTGMKGFGAEMNGCQIHVGKQDSMSEAIVAMGSPPAESSLNMSLLGIKALMPKVRTIRMLGSAALMLAWVANGRLTCYWECKYFTRRNLYAPLKVPS